MAVYDHRLTALRPSYKCLSNRHGNCVITFEQKPQKAEKKKKKKKKSLELICQMNITIALINKKEITRCSSFSEPCSHLTVNDQIVLSIDQKGFDPRP